MRPRDVSRVRRFKARLRAWAYYVYLDPQAVVIGGRKVEVSPRYAKPRNPMFPTGPIKVVSIRPRLIALGGQRADGRGNSAFFYEKVTRTITLDPYRLQYGYVGKSKARPSELIRKDVESHLRRTRVLNGIAIERGLEKHVDACILRQPAP